MKRASDIPQEIKELPEIIQEVQDVGFLKLEGWKMKQSEFRPSVEAYLSCLDETQRMSFAPTDILIKKALDGIDLHVMALRNTGSPQKSNDIMGLVIFNQES